MKKYVAVVVIAVLVGLHWHCDFGWFLVAMITAFIINYLIDKENEQKDSEDQR